MKAGIWFYGLATIITGIRVTDFQIATLLLRGLRRTQAETML